MDLLSKVYAYELLFSDGPGAILRHDRESAALTMIDNTVLFGLNKLASGRPAFVPCTAEMLSSTLVEVLPAEMTVLEIRPGIDSPETPATNCGGPDTVLRSTSLPGGPASNCWSTWPTM
jgi:c-di-GMP-related signal transduction protein